MELFGDQLIGVGWIITYTRLGADDPVSRDEILDSDLIDDTAKEHLESPEEGLAELRRIYNDYDNLTNANFTDMSMWAAYFGDPEFAIDALEKAFSIQSARVVWIWAPVMRKVRQLPRFKEFVREIGLVDYWKEYGWPDLCRPVGDDDFVCD
ncbi:MAG: hypothetical protein JRE24_12070 [Deltaproteobacteria bacterium]|nr:hypothetical protein [Deltaproteobacteria bacterium]